MAQSALDGRHGHRDLRLHAPAVRARRRALFAGHRPADREPDRHPDGRPRHGAAGEARGSICWRRSCAAARASTARNWPSCRRKASSGSRSTASSTRSPTAPALDKKFKHDIDVVVDRIVVRADLGNRLADSIETALKLADGLAVAEFADKPLPAADIAESANKSKNETHERLRSRSASPARSRASPSTRSSRGCSRSTIPFGACPACDGLGTELRFEPELVVPDESLSLPRARSCPGPRPATRRPITCRRWKRGQALQRRDDDAVAGPAEEGARRDPATAPAASRSTLRTTTASAPTRPTSRSRASSATSSGAGGRRIPHWMREELARYQSDHALRGLQRLPAQAGGAGRQDRRPAHRRGHRAVDPRGRRLVRRAAGQAQAQAAGDRRSAS